MARVSGSEKTVAVSYLRTSSAANVGAEKDSAYRQDAAVVGYAARAGVEVVACFYDAAVSGAVHVADAVPSLDPFGRDGHFGLDAQGRARAAVDGAAAVVVDVRVGGIGRRHRLDPRLAVHALFVAGDGHEKLDANTGESHHVELAAGTHEPH